MKNSEQLDQLQLLGVSVVDFLILPRWVGCLLASLSLTLLGIVVAVLVSSQLASYGLG
ncbi:ABC transporter permease, partial [bacterium]|nr:ABC transporter permease [bacterium]